VIKVITAVSFLAAQNSDPVIVKIADPPAESIGIADVLIRALGFVGLLAVVGVLSALAVGGFLYWRRSRAD
jgi:hypothetical protein